MWIVRLALRRPYTFIVGALLIVIFGALAAARMATDIFPEIDIPIVAVIWQYNGMPPEEMERRIVTGFERGLTTSVNDIEHIESQTLNGVSITKVFFHPGAKIEAAVAQISAQAATNMRQMPPGITPPNILRFNASNVPVLQVSLSSPTLAEQEIFDLAQNFMRTRLATVQGASIPLPFGGRNRQIMVDLDPAAMFARGVSASDVSSAINAQNLILPSGNMKVAERDYYVRLNGSPEVVQGLNELPIKTVNGNTVYIKDVAQVRDGFGIQSNIVRRDGHRGALMMILRSSGASTLDIVRRVREIMPSVESTLPAALNVEILSDQSVFVRNSLNGVIGEALLAASLTALLIFMFLGSWRSTLIVALSIPLSILTSVVLLGAMGQTINMMTLGGLALAVGILVDNATVGIENIHRNLDQGKSIQRAILDGTQQVASPTFVSTLAICIVFAPVFFLSGVAGSLFAPLAMAVIFAVLASYVLSLTLVPTLVRYALAREAQLEATQPHKSWLERLHLAFDRVFERSRARYHATLNVALANPRRTTGIFVVFCAASLVLVPFIGQDFFPRVDSGRLRVHLRAPAGTRLEQTEQITAAVETTIRKVIPASDLDFIIDNVGIALAGSNLAVSDNPTIGASDGEIVITLKPERKGSTFEYRKQLRKQLAAEYPDVTFFFQAADIVGQILNFGLPAPIDVQVAGPNKKENYALIRQIQDDIRKIPGAVDVHIHQVINAPELALTVDRIRSSQMGLTQRDVATSILLSLSGSGQTAPNFWLNPANGVQYNISVQTPQHRMSSLDALRATPVLTAGVTPQLLGNLASVERRTSFAVVNHYNVQPTFDVYANVQDRDLGGVAADVDRVVASYADKLPRGTTIAVRGQVESMRSSFLGLGFGLLFAVVLVYLLMVVNFQSWLDPFIIIMALPGAVAGIVWALFASSTTLSVPALMGAIMSMGVATANSILIVSFANEQRRLGVSAGDAALLAGYTRLRPVVMTALAMIIGMLPMALGLGEGAEQNAPLGRAVIGGLVVATFATLFFVPVVYSVLRTKAPVEHVLEDEHVLVEAV
jgi:CzcA family heavy metal efflux pump